MRKLWVAVFGVTLLLSTWVTANPIRAAAPKARPNLPSWAQKCTAKGSISYMFWGDKGELAQQLYGVHQAEKACPGLKVNAFQDPNYDTDLKTKIGSGNAPDVFQVDAAKGTLKQFVSQGAVTSLDSFAKKTNFNPKSVFWAKCLPDLYIHGHLYGLMRDCGNQGILFYNKDMFTARGVKFPTNSWTNNDLANAAAKLSGTYSLPTDPTSTLRFGIGFPVDDFAMNRMFWQYGGDWLSANLKTCTLDTKPVQDAFQWWINLRYTRHGAPTAEQASAAGDPVGGFASQHYAMMFAGPWALDYVFNRGKYAGGTPPKFKWGFVRTPKGPKNRQAVMGAAAEVIYSGSHNKNAAWWLLQFLTQHNPLEARYGIGIPGDKSVINDKGIQKEYGGAKNLKTIISLQSDGRAIRSLTQYDKWIDVVTKALDPMWKNQMSVQDGTKAACDAAKSAGVLGS